MRQGAGFGGQHDELRGPHACAVVDVFLNKIRRRTALVPGRANQIHHVPRQRFGDRHHTHELLEIQNFFGVGYGLDLGHARGRSEVDYFYFVIGA